MSDASQKRKDNEYRKLAIGKSECKLSEVNNNDAYISEFSRTDIEVLLCVY